MKYIRQVLICTFLFYTTALFAATATTVTPTDTAKQLFPKTLNLAGQTWQLDNYQTDENLILGEYTLSGQTVKNWQELVTIQKFKFTVSKNFTPKLFADKEAEELRQQKYKIIYNLISSNDHEALMEFRVEEPAKDQQDELQRIVLTPDQKLIIMHYVTKKSDMGDAARKRWTDALGKYDLSQLKG